MILAVTGLATGHAEPIKKSMHWNAGKGYRPFKHATYKGIEIYNNTDTLKYDYCPLDVYSEEFLLTFRAKNYNGNPSKKYTYYNERGEKRSVRHPVWGFFITTKQDTLVVTVRETDIVKDTESQAAVEIKIYDLAKGSGDMEAVTEGINPYHGDNLWGISVDNGHCRITGGDTGMQELLTYDMNSGKVTGFGFAAGWGSHLLVSDIKAEITLPGENIVDEYYDPKDLEEIFKTSEDPLEGYWTVFDRELDEDLLKLGGSYMLGCVKDDDKYYLVYLEGANINRNAWREGDVKATLTPTHFRGVYDVTWYDSMKEPMSKDIKAQRGDGNTLTIQFPYQSSQLRLRKVL